MNTNNSCSYYNIMKIAGFQKSQKTLTPAWRQACNITVVSHLGRAEELRGTVLRSQSRSGSSRWRFNCEASPAKYYGAPGGHSRMTGQDNTISLEQNNRLQSEKPTMPTSHVETLPPHLEGFLMGQHNPMAPAVRHSAVRTTKVTEHTWHVSGKKRQRCCTLPLPQSQCVFLENTPTAVQPRHNRQHWPRHARPQPPRRVSRAGRERGRARWK